MTFQDWGICLTIIISTISLIIAIFIYWTNKPKLKIEITDKEWDCFFGKVIYMKELIFKVTLVGLK